MTVGVAVASPFSTPVITANPKQMQHITPANPLIKATHAPVDAPLLFMELFL
jgi:hypothetical protein